MKTPFALVCAAIAALLVTPALAAKPKVDKKIFAGTFQPTDIILNSSTGDFVTYTNVNIRMARSGKVTGSATRYDSVSDTIVTVTASGKIKGKPKLRGKDKERYALAKATVTFSDGAKCDAQFASRNFKGGKRFRALAPEFIRGMFLKISLLLLGVNFSGSIFWGVE